jgi:hypothetical protein
MNFLKTNVTDEVTGHIVAFKNKPIAGIDQFQRCLGATEIGVTSPITVVRHTEKLELWVTPEEWAPSVRRN